MSRGREMREGERKALTYGIRHYVELLAVRDALAVMIAEEDYHDDIDPKFYARAFAKVNSKIGIVEATASPDKHDDPVGVEVDL
jgi:hypothetical protein